MLTRAELLRLGGAALAGGAVVASPATAALPAPTPQGDDEGFLQFGALTERTALTFYRTALKQRGELVYEIPATHAFDVGRYNEDTMAFPPGVTIKDYESEVSQGYPNPKPGGTPARFPTVIQIVPVGAR